MLTSTVCKTVPLQQIDVLASAVSGFESHTSLKENLKMFRKVKYEDEKQPIPVMWTVVIALAVVAGLLIGMMKFCDWLDKKDAELQYEYQIEEVL